MDWCISYILEQIEPKLISLLMNSNVPASILDKSRISDMSCSNKFEFSLMTSRHCFCSSGVSTVVNASANPTIAFTGVRISCPMFDKKTDFCLSFSSAFCLACNNSCSIFFISEISMLTPIITSLFSDSLQSTLRVLTILISPQSVVYSSS